MRNIVRVMMGCIAMLVARQAVADCRLIVLVDRTGSMVAPSTTSMTKTRCQVAQDTAMEILRQYEAGMDFDLTNPMPGGMTRFNYTVSCPSPSQRLVQVWEFQGDVMQPVWPAAAAGAVDGFLPVNLARPRVEFDTGWYDSAGLSTGSCPGASTPMAQAMCRVARAFPLTAPAPGEARVVKILTDGQENSSDVVPVAAGETRCRAPGESEATWRASVHNEFVSRAIQTDAVLFENGGTTVPLLPAAALEPAASARGYRVGDVVSRPAVGSPAPSPDAVFFSALAAATNGRFEDVTLTTPLSPNVTLADSDHDGIPDFRDVCIGPCANDADQDGIPDASDLCPLLAEDGRGSNRTDGCPDTDGDGIRNPIDSCPSVREDGRAPLPADGCPAAVWSGSATPNLATVDNGTACTSLSVTTRSDASLVKLDLFGTHSFRFVLRGTLTHNGVTVPAFPSGSFPTGPGSFSFTDREIPGLSGDSSGTWTLCITDTDGFGDAGVLTTWAVHSAAAAPPT